LVHVRKIRKAPLMSNSPRATAALLAAAAAATVGIGLAPAVPANAETGASTQTTILATTAREPVRPNPVRQLVRAIVTLPREILRDLTGHGGGDGAKRKAQ
jgi:outer membrane receptor protein involved in Fe transport